MRDSVKVRVIFAELRKSFGQDVPAGDVLRLANIILKAYDPALEESELQRASDSRSFFALPVDVAMEDGGWRILNFETRRNFGIEDVEPQEMAVLKVQLQKVLGPAWQQRIRED